MTAYPELRPCTRCLRVTRPSGKSPAEYPFETTVRRTTNLCRPCYRDEQRQPVETFIPEIRVDETTHAVNMRGYLRWLSRRQCRLAAK